MSQPTCTPPACPYVPAYMYTSSLSIRPSLHVHLQPVHTSQPTCTPPACPYVPAYMYTSSLSIRPSLHVHLQPVHVLSSPCFYVHPKPVHPMPTCTTAAPTSQVHLRLHLHHELACTPQAGVYAPAPCVHPKPGHVPQPLVYTPASVPLD